MVSTGDGPWRWFGGVFLNRYDGSGRGFEYAPGLRSFRGHAILSGNPVSEPVEYYSLGTQAVEERALFGVVPPACSSVVRIRADSGRRGGYADAGTARVGRQRRGVARTRRTWCRFPRRGPSDTWCCAINSVARAWIFVQGHRLVFYICTSFP